MPLTLAIVGRPNVGKSSIFNRLLGKRLAIVHDTPGVTRDRSIADAVFNGLDLRVIDTADMPDAPVPGGPPKIVATGNGGMRFDAALLTRPVVMDRSTMQARAREQILDQATRAALQDFLKDRRRAALIQEQPAPAAQR